MALCDEEFTIGVEEEYQIIDPVTRELSTAASEAILLEARKTLGEKVQPEIHLSQIEVATSVCHTLAEVHADLVYLRQALVASAATYGKRIAASGSHPFSHWKEQRITPRERYQVLEQEYQQLAREQSIFGCHVHIGLHDRESALQVINRARPWLPVLLALSSNSPFWWGTDTGYSSYRTEIWSRWPFSGPPPFCASLREYRALTQALINVGGVEDLTKIYWDMRLSERYNTVEIRIMDACMTVDDAVMIAGLVRALVYMCYEEIERGESYLASGYELLRAANWRAARYGLDGELVDVVAGRLMPAKQLIKKFLKLLRPALEAHGDWERISASVDWTLSHGVGAARQREVYQRSSNFQELVDFILAETIR